MGKSSSARRRMVAGYTYIRQPVYINETHTWRKRQPEADTGSYIKLTPEVTTSRTDFYTIKQNSQFLFRRAGRDLWQDPRYVLLHGPTSSLVVAPTFLQYRYNIGTSIIPSTTM